MIDAPTFANGAIGLGVLAGAVFTGWQSWQARRRAEAGAQAAEDARGNTEEVRATLTTNNGGSHVKDALDRIESRQALQADATDDLRDAFRDHTESSERAHHDLYKRLDRLERRPRLLPFL